MKKKSSSPTSPPSAPRIARVYIRQSNSGGRGDSDDNLSPRLQLEQARPYCQLHNLSLDEDASLRHADVDQRAFRRTWKKRPGLVGHLEDAKAGLFTDLIVYKLSRLARNAREGLDIFAEFEALGVALHVVKEGIDTATASGRLMRTIMLGVSEMEAENISQFVSDAIRSRHSQGKAWGHPHWLDHVVERDAAGKVILDTYTFLEPNASAMRRLVALRKEGRSYVDIARTLNAEGHVSARSTWGSSTVRHFLSPEAIDAMEGHYAGGTLSRLENVWPRLLTVEEAAVLRQIQDAFTSSTPESWRRPGNGKARGKAAHTSFLLSSLVFCGQCGQGMRSHTTNGGVRSKSKKPFYVCEPREDATADLHTAPRGGLNASAAMLHDAAARVVRVALLNPPPSPPKRKTAPKGQKTARIDADIVKLTNQLDNLVRMRMEDRIADDEYDRLRAELLQKRADLQKISPVVQAEASSIYQSAQAAFQPSENADEEDIRRAWRETFLLILQRVDARIPAPPAIASLEPPNTKGNVRDWARITLRYPCSLGTVFWAPLYPHHWSGERNVFPEIQ